jgi:trbC/VIRB2 family
MNKLSTKKNVAKLLLAGVATLGLTTAAFASGTPGGGAAAKTFGDNSDSFGDLLKQFTEWMRGNLGKLLALIGFIGTFVIYLMTHKGSVLFIGVIISLIAGGLVGIVATFFSAGEKAFEIH